MAFYDPVVARLKSVKQLSPGNLKRLTDDRLSELVLKEVPKSKARIEQLQQRYPSAGTRELAQRIIDGKKSFASMVGGVSGVFGVLSVPADLAVIAYLQVMLLVDIATVYKVNLKSERSRRELLDLFGYTNGVGPMARSGPRVLGAVAAKILEKGGLATLGRAVPLVAAPVTAYLNSLHLQHVGEDAVRHYEGFKAAHEKTKKASNG